VSLHVFLQPVIILLAGVLDVLLNRTEVSNLIYMFPLLQNGGEKPSMQGLSVWHWVLQLSACRSKDSGEHGPLCKRLQEVNADYLPQGHANLDSVRRLEHRLSEVISPGCHLLRPL
jgi:hypothetical protein